MNMEYLKTFYITVGCNSISKAAKLLHMSQPGVSIQLQALEKDLGVTLLSRSNKGVELTEEGEVVYDYAMSLLAIQGNIERKLDCLKNQKKEMVISSCTTVGSYALPCSLYIFKEKFPHVNVLLNITNSGNVVKSIQEGAVQMGIIEGCCNKTVYDTKELDLVKVTSEKLKLVVSPNRYKKDKVSLAEFLKLPLVLREKGSGTREIVECSLAEAGTSLEHANVVMELSSPEAIKSSIVAGKGFSVFSQLAVKKELATGALREVEVTGFDFVADYFLVHLHDYIAKGVEKDFAEFIKSDRRAFC